MPPSAHLNYCSVTTYLCTQLAAVAPEAFDGLSAEQVSYLESRVRYEGYIRREMERLERLKPFESRAIPRTFAYEAIPGLSREVVEKCSRRRPRTVGDASRIPGRHAGRHRDNLGACRPSRGKSPRSLLRPSRRFCGPPCPASGSSSPPRSSRDVGRYLSELDHWRRRINLTGRSLGRRARRPYARVTSGVGCNCSWRTGCRRRFGGRIPGPAALDCPAGSQVTLVEPRAKKCAFLRHVARTLKLSNVSVFEGRIEEVGGQTFDVATTRALGRYRRVAGWRRASRAGRLSSRLDDDAGGTRGQPLGRRSSLAGSIPIPGAERRQIAVLRRR